MKVGMGPAGALLTAAVVVGGGAAAGLSGALGAASGGAIAALVQWAAVRRLAGQTEVSTRDFVRRWATAAALRLLGVALVTVLVVAARDAFPPLPTALGFLGVLLPLMALELRMVR
jgi:hypothetical protein